MGLVATTLVACGKTTENKNQAPEVKEPEKIVYYTPLTHEERDNEDQAKKKSLQLCLITTTTQDLKHKSPRPT